MIKQLVSSLLVLSCLLFVRCGSDGESNDDASLLVSTPDATLTRDELAKALPISLSKEDSVLFAQTYIRNWIDGHLLYKLANRNVENTELIERMVEQYRRELTIYQYEKEYIEEKLSREVTDQEIAQFYKNNASLFTLPATIVKGVYLKLPEHAPNLSQVRRWYRTPSDNSTEELEKYALKTPVTYDFFMQRWVPFDTFMQRIPYQIARSGDFLKYNKTLEVKQDGFIYLLYIDAYQPKGAVAPLDYAAPQIREMIVNQRKTSYLNEIKEELYNQAIEHGDVKHYQ